MSVTSGQRDCVKVEQRDRVRLLILNRPERRNAIDLTLRRVLAEEIEAAMDDPAVRSIVLTGAGGSFCSGGDISTMRTQPEEETRSRTEAAQRVVRALWSGPKPVVAAVEGAAYGAGVALAIACDRVIASSEAVFSTTFTRVGLAGDLGIHWSLPRRVGTARARQMLMLPTQVHAARALEWGLVDGLAEPGGALDAALADASLLADGPPLALAAIKSTLNEGAEDPFAMLEREAATQIGLWGTSDFAEGVAAFHERRAPVFRGK